MKKVLITGAKGFIGKNLEAALKAQRDDVRIATFDVDTPAEKLEEYCRDCSFVYHLAGVNRPRKTSAFMSENFGFTSVLLDTLKKHGNTCPVMLASSIQAECDNPYGKSKLAGEQLLRRYGEETGARVLIYRFQNLFGRWGKPNYNSVVATFCYRLNRDLPIQVNDRSHTMELVSVGDVTAELLRALDGKEHVEGEFCRVLPSYPATLGYLADTLEAFRRGESPAEGDELAGKLYDTYRSYAPKTIRVLVTGAKGFIGKNLIAALENSLDARYIVYPFDVDTPREKLLEYTRDCDFLFNFAAVHRPKENKEFREVNALFFEDILELLEKNGNACPVVYTSSIQAENGSEYGKSKTEAERSLREHAQRMGSRGIIYRLTNVFGKWAMPNHHSVVATFCHNIARDLPIAVSDPTHEMHFYYIDDVIASFLDRIAEGPCEADRDFYVLPKALTYPVTLGELADTLRSFQDTRKNLGVPDCTDSFEKKLYATYLSYLPEDGFAYPLVMHTDARGSFTEILRTADRGQFSVNVSKPGITKGNHWHHTKNEKFVVVSGKGVIRFRKPDSEEIIEYAVSGDQIQVVDIPTGYTHAIENVGDTDLVTFMWCNECFDPHRPDTYYLEV